MKTLIAVATIAAGLASVSAPANAFPLLNGQVTAGGPEIVQVGWRCGPHRHWSWRRHHCVWNRDRY